MDTWQALYQLSTSNGPPGYEEAVASVVTNLWRPFVDDMKTDVLGNLIARKKPTRVSETTVPTVMLATHMDEIALIVSQVEENGFLRVQPLGGVDTRLVFGQEVLVHARPPFRGVLTALPARYRATGNNDKAPTWDDCYIDTGFSTHELRVTVGVGDLVTFAPPCLRLQGERAVGKAFDNRTSIAVVYDCLQRLARLSHAVQVIAVATVQEEVGLRGAITSTYSITPQAGIAIDVGFGVTPGLSEREALKLGKGPGITLGANIHRGLRARLLQSAESENIPWQVEVAPASSGTDAWGMQVSQVGVPTAVISIPLRYMHSPVECADLNDLTSAGRLLAHFLANLEPEEVWGWANGPM